MSYIKLGLAVTVLSIYSFFLLKPFIGEINKLESHIDYLEDSKKQKVEIIKKCKESRDSGTKRFIDYFDEEIDVINNSLNKDTSDNVPSWSNATLGIKGEYAN